MWEFKGCPRCGGDTFIDEYLGQSYESCLQCGYERELVKVSVKKQQHIKEDQAASLS